MTILDRIVDGAFPIQRVPTIRATDITVGSVLTLVASGKNAAEIVALNPSLEVDDVQAALEFLRLFLSKGSVTGAAMTLGMRRRESTSPFWKPSTLRDRSGDRGPQPDLSSWSPPRDEAAHRSALLTARARRGRAAPCPPSPSRLATRPRARSFWSAAGQSRGSGQARRGRPLGLAGYVDGCTIR